MQAAPRVSRSRQQLFDLYKQWESLTQSEWEAICGSRWPELAGLQAGKRALQDSIATAAQEWETECQRRGFRVEHSRHEFCGIVESLVRLEARNIEYLEAQMERVRAETKELDGSTKSLRQVKKAYSLVPNPIWHSYS